MHELAICQALVDQVGEIARREQAPQVTGITLRVGPLSGVVPELLRHAFPLAAAGSVAAAAELRIDELAVRVSCNDCGEESEVAINRLLCGRCGGYRTRLLSGDELILASVELIRSEESAGDSATQEASHV